MKTRFQRDTRSTRQLRRLAEREANREKRQQAVEAFWKLPPEVRAQRMADDEAFQRISRNGITVEDMHRVEMEAFDAGVREGKKATVRTCFAAICLSLHELHGFGKERCSKVLNDVYNKLQFALTSQDAIDEVYDTIGLKLTFNGDVTEDAVREA